MRARIGRNRWPLLVGLALLIALGLAIALTHPRRPPRLLSSAPLRGVTAPLRTIPYGLLGFNGEAVTGGGQVWSDPSFVGAVAALHPQAIRVFGGTPANYWDWRTGTFNHSRLLPGNLSALRPIVHITLPDWARIVQAAHALPVFDLNVLTSNLSSQLAMLRAARALGMPVTHVELGNELYLPYYSSRFRTGAAYGRVASRWIAAIKREFPGVLIAADAYPGPDSNGSTVNARELHWNSGMLSTLRGEAALSMHSYFASGLGPRASLASSQAAQDMLKAPVRRFIALAALMAKLHTRASIWVTEWNLFDTVARVHETWAQGLAVAAYGLDLLSAPRVVQADYHALVSNGPFDALFGSRAELYLGAKGGTAFRAVSADPPATPQFGLAAGGVAMQALLGALANANELRGIQFGSFPVGGDLFTGGQGPGAVIVNLTDAVARIAVPKALQGLQYVERYAPPITLVAGLDTLQARSDTTAATLDLEPFSLLWIK